jgi:hypothetical protein
VTAAKAKSLSMKCILAFIPFVLAQGFGASAFMIQPSLQSKTLAVVDWHHPRTRPSLLSMKPLRMAEDDENLDIKNDETKGFDGEGLSNYLLPYALAAVASVAVTAAFVKFVLLDY